MRAPVFYTSLSILCLASVLAFAQKSMPEGYFAPPMETKPSISGTFAEPRPDHMHSGLDYSTSGRIGSNVYAVAAGYVSRIKVTAGGYGRAIYVTHPNGYVSVYGHLNEFNVVVEDYVARKQKEKETFEIELFPDPVLFPVNKGDIVGYSGNTGSSTGPHLHFEIRSEHSERPINPMLLGINITDLIAPVVSKIKIYPEGNGSLVNGINLPAVYAFEKIKGSSTYNLQDTVKVTGSCSLGMLVDDYVSDNSNSTGVASWDLSVDGVTFFSCRPDSFSFDETRMVNDLIDYPEYMSSRTRFLLFRKSPGNLLNIYGKLNNRGILTFSESRFVRVALRARDFAGNEAVVNLVIKGQPATANLPVAAVTDSSRIFVYDRPAHFQTADFTLDMQPNTLFDNINFYYEAMKTWPGTYGPLHRIGKASVPLIKPVQVALNAGSVPAALQSKLLIARIQVPSTLVSAGGEYKDGYVTGQISRFGDYAIVADTVPPMVKPVGFSSHKNINALQTLRFYTTDDLSGVKLYRAVLNGSWVLMEYDPKNNLLVIPVDDRFEMGRNELHIVVIDAKNNITEQNYTLIR